MRTSSDNDLARAALSWLGYPLLLGGGAVTAAVAIGAGGAPTRVAAVVVACGSALIALGERLHPYLPAWRRPHGDRLVDVAHTAIGMLPIPAVFRVLALGVLGVLGARLVEALGASPWPSRWPLALQLLLALVVAELGQYWIHRLSHRGLLWRVHRLHHSAERLYWLNAGRFHPLDNLLQYAAEMSPLIVLGAPPSVLAIFTVFTALNGELRHANIDLRFGPLGWVLSTADLHRWHHSSDLDEADANFGANLILWDVVFGTRRVPGDGRRHPRRLGLLEQERFPRGYLGQLASPFVSLDRATARAPRPAAEPAAASPRRR